MRNEAEFQVRNINKFTKLHLALSANRKFCEFCHIDVKKTREQGQCDHQTRAPALSSQWSLHLRRQLITETPMRWNKQTSAHFMSCHISLALLFRSAFGVFCKYQLYSSLLWTASWSMELFLYKYISKVFVHNTAIKSDFVFLLVSGLAFCYRVSFSNS